MISWFIVHCIYHRCLQVVGLMVLSGVMCCTYVSLAEVLVVNTRDSYIPRVSALRFVSQSMRCSCYYSSTTTPTVQQQTVMYVIPAESLSVNLDEVRDFKEITTVREFDKKKPANHGIW